MYEFHRTRTAPPGAILALTSSADKEATDDVDAMGEFIKRYAEAIYRRASSLRAIGEKDSLYIITACIKSDSWAMAAYDADMDPQHPTLRLVPVLPVRDGEVPKYEWSSQGTSRARVGRSDKKQVKDQSLFLQGYKMAFSPRFRDRLKASGLRDDEPETPGATDRGEDHRHGPSGPFGREPRSGGRERKPGGGGPTAPVRQSGSHNHAFSVGSPGPPSQDIGIAHMSTAPRPAPGSPSMSGDAGTDPVAGASSAHCTVRFNPGLCGCDA